jgi:hypothetical protein
LEPYLWWLTYFALGGLTRLSMGPNRVASWVRVICFNLGRPKSPNLFTQGRIISVFSLNKDKFGSYLLEQFILYFSNFFLKKSHLFGLVIYEKHLHPTLYFSYYLSLIYLNIFIFFLEMRDNVRKYLIFFFKHCNNSLNDSAFWWSGCSSFWSHALTLSQNSFC